MQADQDLELLIAIVDHAGFQTAADALGLPRSTVSKRLARLEERTKVRLLNRNAHGISLTPAGQVYYDYGKRAMATLNEAHRLVAEMRDEPSGTIRVTCAVMIAMNAIIPRLPLFFRRYPLVRLELHLSDKIEDLVGSGFDVAIRMGGMADSTLISRRILSARRILCASPDYLERHGHPKRPEDLRHHNCLNLLTLGRLRNEWSFRIGERTERIEVSGNFTTDSGAAHYAAVLGGIGIGRITYMRSVADLEQGRLLRLLSDYELDEESAIRIVFPSTRQLAPATRAFIDFAAGLEANL
jgi:DNA-binding transcriptional LysR family regulator